MIAQQASAPRLEVSSLHLAAGGDKNYHNTYVRKNTFT